MSASIVIGLVGEKRAGKQTFVGLLLRALDRNFWNPGHKHFEFSEPIRIALERLGLERKRQNYQNFAIVVDELFGEGTIMRGTQLMIERVISDLKIADGVRWLIDEKLIRSFEFNLMVYVTASPEVRYKRALEAANAKVGEKQMTWEEFLATDQAKTEIYIPVIGSRADFKIENNGSLEAYEKQVGEFYEKLLKPLVLQKKNKPLS